MSEHLALYLLGPPRLELNHAAVTVDRRKTLALLAYLAVNRWQHHRDHISALLWPEHPQPKAFSNLRHVLWEMRHALGDAWIDSKRDTLGLSGLADLWLDVAEFENLTAQSFQQTELSLRIPLLIDSVKLYRNHFLTGFSLKDAPGFNEWAVARGEALRRLLARVLTMLADDLCSSDQAETAMPYAQQLVGLDPLNESSHRQLMQIYLQAGQHTAALKQYQTCERILRKELGVDPQPETRALYKQIRKGEIKLPEPARSKTTDLTRHNLPFQISKFIGREKEIREVRDLIGDNRLVALVGTGGIGKTRLSLKVGEELVQNFSGGVWFVELAPLADPALVPQSVGKLFHIVEQADEPMMDKLVRVLRPRSMLLILDNCEHVLEACARLADMLLHHCPRLKVLATSREPLGITGESQYHVPPLGLPNFQQILEDLLEHESIQLFAERARLVQERFSLTMENASSVTRICHRLDGIPLAIELAAARVDLLSTDEIAARLDEDFHLLTGGSRTALPRQQTLRASIEWSWKLLSRKEQTVLRRLAVFAGGWTLEAAETICAGNGVESLQVRAALPHLVAKSLVVLAPDARQESRYGLLEMIREYAREKLVDAREEESIRNRHFRYFLDLSGELEYGLMGPQQVDFMARAIDERDNLRAALEHASRTDVEAGLYMSGRLRNFWENFDIREGGRWMAEFLQMPESKQHPLARAKALFAYGWTLLWSHQLDEARSAAQECLLLYRAAGDAHGEVDGLNLMGAVTNDADRKADYCQQALALARALGDVMRQTTALNQLGWDHRDYDRAFACWEEAISLYRQIGSWRYLASVLSMLGLFMVMEGHVEAAQQYLDESAAVYQKLNTKTGKSHLLIAYAQIALLHGEYERARAYLQENARIGSESGSRMEYLWSQVRLGHVERRAGHIFEARQIFGETLRTFQNDGSKIGVVYTVEGIAGLYLLTGKPESAAALIGWADGMREVIGTRRPVLEQAEVDRETAALVTKIGTNAFRKAYENGRAMTLDEAVEYALGDG